QLIVPYGWDQPDNGARVERLGAGLCLARRDYSVQSAVDVLGRLFGDGQFAARVVEVGAQVQGEDALTVACDAIESMFTVQAPDFRTRLLGGFKVGEFEVV